MRASVDIVKERLKLSQDELAAYCQRWKITEMSLIGSISPDDLGAQNPIEFLVRFEPGVMRRYADAVAMERELAELGWPGRGSGGCRVVVDLSCDRLTAAFRGGS